MERELGTLERALRELVEEETHGETPRRFERAREAAAEGHPQPRSAPPAAAIVAQAAGVP